jgi:hypothetical protein
MSGDVTGADGQTSSLAQLVESGRAHAVSDIAGAYAWPIPKDARAHVRIALTTFLIASVVPPRKYESSSAIDWQTQAYTVVTAAAVMLFLLMVD